MDRAPDKCDGESETGPGDAPEGASANRVDSRTRVGRRTVLGALAGAGSAAVAGCSGSGPDDAATTGLDADRLDELAARFAPTLYFDSAEPWFPTDPRPYTVEEDGETVVDGFAAFDGYHERYDETGEPPNPTVFYNGMRYEDSPLAVVQFWMYSAFDQFTANFHWHDWEVLHVFVDLDTGDPQLYVASSHSRSVPNNEFLDPDPDVVPRILPELGSHSSTLSVNEIPDGFRRVGEEGLLADITNTTIDTVEDLLGIPIAYGLPRDEGARLPFVVPEYEGEPIYEHPDLPSVTEESLVDGALTIRSLDALRSPPTDLPLRETGIAYRHGERSGEDGTADGDDAALADEVAESVVEYELVESAELEDISAFTGPQLSFEFAVPQAVEDAVAGHITSTGVPWEQPRYENPALDVTAGNHRSELAARYDAIADDPSFGDDAAGALDGVVARVTRATETDEAPDGEGLTTTDAGVESFVLIESDPEAVPTFAGGVAVANGVPEGDHRLTVNGAGRTPHSETLTVSADEPVTRAGADGEIPLVAREDARKVELDDAESDADLTRTAVEDDFAGRIYDSAIDGSDAVYVHAGGAYTTEVRDADDEVGAYRVNPDPPGAGSDDGDDSGETEDPIRIERPETGAAPLAGYVADVAEETRAAVAAAAAESDDGDDDDGSGGGGDGGGPSNAVNGLEKALAAAVEAAERAEERAREGDREGTDRQLENVVDRIARIEERLAAAREGLPPGLANATGKRIEQATKRVEQAQNSEKL
ncbi:hypothetical protein [Halorubrum distributum]|uniref:Uncharacterized protein n=1 Tax=Halorubrum distributum JCM 10247 TaxID=1227486 RepID=M0DNM9_9EURY|nr:hypothetical protein [Halorubrum terrestre]ELZ37096.1 hypothetical protein C473_01209 [Halorubrum terrestre JCM 10247]